jgi:c-di-GMP-binding flagellar brake protein YcgR
MLGHLAARFHRSCRYLDGSGQTRPGPHAGNGPALGDLWLTRRVQKPVDRQRLTALFRAVRGTLIENRRRHARVPIQTTVVCTIGSRTLNGSTWNLSAGGLQIEVGSLQPGNTVKLSFRVPGSGAMVEAMGVVVWAKQQREGIQFTQVSELTQQTIQQFIAETETV